MAQDRPFGHAAGFRVAAGRICCQIRSTTFITGNSGRVGPFIHPADHPATFALIG
jgi:hypothetical protein